jgi:septal ring factor EnvC (AmiA/AmiB activator)
VSSTELRDLKAECYDIFAQIQTLQNILQEKNQRIADLTDQEKKAT